MRNEISTTVFTIATGKYWGYFLRLLPEIDLHMDPNENIEIIVLTDSKFTVPLHSERITIKKIPIVNEEWPEITLFRYAKIITNKNQISGKYFVWIDVDTSIVKDIHMSKLHLGKKGIKFSRHPGFSASYRFLLSNKLWRYRPEGRAYLRGLQRLFFEDAGWERNPKSTAFIPWYQRRSYVYGAFWLGRTPNILEMCRKLTANIEIDYRKNLIATWHDESHLNQYRSSTNGGLLSKNFVANQDWAWNNSSKATILALDKAKLDAN